MTRLMIFASVVAIGGLIAVTQTVRAQAGDSAAQEAHHPATEQAATMQNQQTQMMGVHQKMMADMKAMDARLDALMTTMNAATGDARVDAIADVVTAVVQQRATMHDGMMQMHGQMMNQMMKRTMSDQGGQ